MLLEWRPARPRLEYPVPRCQEPWTRCRFYLLPRSFHSRPRFPPPHPRERPVSSRRSVRALRRSPHPTPPCGPWGPVIADLSVSLRLEDEQGEETVIKPPIASLDDRTVCALSLFSQTRFPCAISNGRSPQTVILSSSENKLLQLQCKDSLHGHNSL